MEKVAIAAQNQNTNYTQIKEREKCCRCWPQERSLTWQASCVTEVTATGQEARSWGEPAHGGRHPNRWTSATTRRRWVLPLPTPLLPPLPLSTLLPLAKLTSLVQRCESMWWDKWASFNIRLMCNCTMGWWFQMQVNELWIMNFPFSWFNDSRF